VCRRERERERDRERKRRGEGNREKKSLKLSIFAGDIKSMAVVSNECKVNQSSPDILDAIRYSSR